MISLRAASKYHTSKGKQRSEKAFFAMSMWYRSLSDTNDVNWSVLLARAPFCGATEQHTQANHLTWKR